MRTVFPSLRLCTLSFFAVTLLALFSSSARGQTTYATAITSPAQGQLITNKPNNLGVSGTVTPTPNNPMAPPAGVMIYLNQTVGGTGQWTCLAPLGPWDPTNLNWTFSGFFNFMGGLPSGSYDVYAAPVNLRGQPIGPKSPTISFSEE